MALTDTLAVAVVTTYSRLHMALNLARSIRAVWTQQPKVYVGLVDHCGRERPGFESIDDVEIVPASALEVPDFWWQAAKFDPDDFCSALKPYLLRHVIDRGHDTVVSCDPDVHFFGDAGAVIECARSADLVFAPPSPLASGFPDADPTTREIEETDVAASGLVVVRRRPSTRAFLDAWGQLATAPGHVASETGEASGAQALTSALSHVDHVAVFRDPRVHIADANLYRSPRHWRRLDRGREDEWTLDGRPIVCCQFRGLAWSNGPLSSHQDSQDLSLNVHLAAFCRDHRRRLVAAHAASYAAVGYEYGEVEGRRLHGEIREELRHLECVSAPAVDSWKDVPEALRDTARQRGRTWILPRYLERILERRDDLRGLDDPECVCRTASLRWANRWLRYEYPCGVLYESYTDTAFARSHLGRLAREIARGPLGLSIERAVEALCHDRVALLERLRRQDPRPELLEDIENGVYRYPVFDPAVCVRWIYEDRRDLQQAFPDALGADLAKFQHWLSLHLPREYVLPQPMSEFVSTLDPQVSFARLLGYAQRSPAWREALTERGLGAWAVPHLVRMLPHAPGYDASDIVLVMWWLEKHGPAARAAIDRTLVPSLATRTAGAYLEWWYRRNIEPEDRLPASPSPAEGGAALLEVVETLRATLDRVERVDEPGAEGAGRVRRFVTACETARETVRNEWPPSDARTALAKHLGPAPRGINVFGYFRSPIALGPTSSGLVAALHEAGYHTRRVLLADAVMDGDPTPDDLHPDFGFNFPRNIVVTSPRAELDGRAAFPPEFFHGRETSGYVPWERPDFPPRWTAQLERYDRLFAVSRVTADAIAAETGRPCEPIPRVVDVGPAAGEKWPRGAFGIPPDTFVVGLVFEGEASRAQDHLVAAVRAAGRALAGRKALLVVKVRDGHRARSTRPMQALVDEARRHGLEPLLLTYAMPQARVEALIACFDVYLSLHRGDGSSYRIAQAMMLGVPVVAPGYPENLEFMTTENSYVVASHQIAVRFPHGAFPLNSVREEPDLDDAVEQCRHVYGNPGEARRKAASARADVEAVASVTAVARRLRQLFA